MVSEAAAAHYIFNLLVLVRIGQRHSSGTNGRKNSRQGNFPESTGSCTAFGLCWTAILISSVLMASISFRATVVCENGAIADDG